MEKSPEKRKELISELVCDSCARNEKFLLEKGILDEFVNLIDDVIDFMSYYGKKWDSEKERLMRSPFSFMFTKILLS